MKRKRTPGGDDIPAKVKALAWGGAGEGGGGMCSCTATCPSECCLTHNMALISTRHMLLP